MTPPITAIGLLTADQVKDVLGAATRASSTRPTPAWRVRCTPAGFELHTDPRCAPPPAGQRELLLSGGAALFNLRTAIHVLGAHPATSILPDRDAPTLLALVRPFAAIRPDPRLVRLARAIAHQDTGHAPSGHPKAPETVLTELRHAAEVEQAWLHRPGPDHLTRLSELTGHHHPPQPPSHHDRAAAPPHDRAWIRPSPDPDRRARPDEPLIVVIGSLDDTREDRIRAGQARQRVLLTATAAGLHTTFLAPPVEVPAARARLRTLLGKGLWPQAVLRLARTAPGPQPTA
ncbi:hypothetical protein [Amycolatopsis sp. PS_44_ISF1]|uniref:hypothetical protein n=1 Tax=Amycolatopsis sp. PS_44_ISF1 TaxID=2974917 RepID=UPI0028DF5237|nr:hypothetical protein [Amycolatopsis sp. PS_44_ISF1]MDT8912400.1 hypothetical protein [Amycolatopsis sp. PS_44_ISF1]